jgi:uncharacterized integral membrane protein
MVGPIDRLVQLGFIISGIIAIIIVMSVVSISVLQALYSAGEYKIPDVLANWGGVIVGFYFGTFVSLIKDYMRLEEKRSTSEPQAPEGVPPRVEGGDAPHD